jgi:hypothetical protein
MVIEIVASPVHEEIEIVHAENVDVIPVRGNRRSSESASLIPAPKTPSFFNTLF